MRLFYTLCFFCCTATLLFAQEAQFGPVQGNPVLRSHVAVKTVERDAVLERFYGQSPTSSETDRDGLNDCPPELPANINLVESGGFIILPLDTFGFAVDSNAAVLETLNDPPLQYGMVGIIGEDVVYIANDGILDYVADTVRIRYTQGGVVDTTLIIAVDVKREGQTIVTGSVNVDPGEIRDFCLDGFFNFPTPRNCFQFEDCFTNYDGDGNQFSYFTSDSCFIYIASRFPGVDTVCVQICDEIGICDIFKVPFIITGDTISIKDQPFFEDFSQVNGPYPVAERWLDDDVYVNYTFAPNPPSVGMATFDGLDRGGSPYELPAGGVGDQLTSKAIDLSSYNNNSDVYLRFFLSPKGYGQEPEEDPFYVEFRNSNREWVQVLEIDAPGSLAFDTIPPFTFYSIKVEDASFFHDAFQMRFTAENSPGGYGDWWHLDYIHLDKTSTEVNNFPDFAFSTLPFNFLKNYRAMPLRHLKAGIDDEIIPAGDSLYKVGVSNRRGDLTVNFSDSNADYVESTTMNDLVTNAFTLADANESSTAPLSHLELSPNFNATADLKTSINNLPDNSHQNIQSVFSFVPNIAEESDDPYEINNTVVLNTPLQDYFARDDGSAEIQFFWNLAQGGEETAVRYKANVTDSLRAVQFMFPHFSFYDIESQFMTLKIWEGDENFPIGEPVFERDLLRPNFPDALYDTLQGFTTYQLVDIFGDPTPIEIKAGTYFYVGYEQVSNATRGIPIGYDLDSPCGCNVRKKLSEWKAFTANDPEGALMIRAVFGQAFDTTNPANEINQDPSVVRLFPNPVSTVLNVEYLAGLALDYEYILFNQLGQPVQQGTMAPQLDLVELPEGMYFLQIYKPASGQIWMEQVMVSNRQ